MQFELPLNNTRPVKADVLSVGGREIPVVVVRSCRARRYVLRLRADGLVRLTIPRHGSADEARRFAERHAAWLERQLQDFSTRPLRPREWFAGSDIFFRGELVKIETLSNENGGSARIGGECVAVAKSDVDLRPAIEKHLRGIATRELPARTLELAAQHQLTVRRVTVRAQRSRWGSCSCRGVISLNWRLVQTPPSVRDYIILHELMHLRQMNHSARFWREVERVCPEYRKAKLWLKENPGLLDRC